MRFAVAFVSLLVAILCDHPLGSKVKAEDTNSTDNSSSSRGPTASAPDTAEASTGAQPSPASDTALPDLERVRSVLSELDARIAEVERKRSQITWAGPSAVMVVGAGLTAGGIFLARFHSALADSLGPEGEPPSSPSAGAYFIFVSPGVLVILVGATRLAMRAREHEALTKERDQLLNRKRILTSALVPSVSPSRLGLEFRLRF